MNDAARGETLLGAIVPAARALQSRADAARQRKKGRPALERPFVIQSVAESFSHPRTNGGRMSLDDSGGYLPTLKPPFSNALSLNTNST